MNEPLKIPQSNSDLIHGLKPEELFAAGLQASAEEAWKVLTPEEVAMMLPALEISRIINQGGMGAVYEGWQKDLRRRVAVKLLSPKLTDTPGQATRFRYEARLMAQLSHPGIVQIHEAGETAEGNLYYVMELIDGEDLATRMHRERLAIDEAVGIICHVAEALQAAHALGVVHRDVKPGNILLPKNGPPKLGDFGLALTTEQASDSLRLTRAGTTLGTLEYAAPEQLSKAVSASPASDVYSLGVLTYELLTGELPRGNFDPPSVRNEAVDPAFDGVVLRALQSDPTRRYKDAGEFHAALKHAADRLAQQELRNGEVRRRLMRRARATLIFGGLAVLATVAAIYGWRQRTLAQREAAGSAALKNEADGLVSFMVNDLGDSLEDIGRLDLLERSLSNVEGYFKRQENELMDPIALRNKAGFFRTLLMLKRERAQWQEANVAAEEGLEVYKLLAKQHPSELSAQQELARMHYLYGYSLGIQKRFDEAIEQQHLSRKVLSGGEGSVPEDRESQRMWIVSSRHLAAALMDSGKLEEARTLISAVAAVNKEAIKVNDDRSRSFRMEMGTIELIMGSLAERIPDYTAALQHFEAGREHYRKAEPSTWNFEHQFALCGAGTRVSTMLSQLKRWDEAMQALQEPLRIVDHMEQQAPNSTSVLAQDRHVSAMMGHLYQQKGDEEKASLWNTRSNTAKGKIEAALKRK